MKRLFRLRPLAAGGVCRPECASYPERATGKKPLVSVREQPYDFTGFFVIRTTENHSVFFAKGGNFRLGKAGFPFDIKGSIPDGHLGSLALRLSNCHLLPRGL